MGRSLGQQHTRSRFRAEKVIRSGHRNQTSKFYSDLKLTYMFRWCHFCWLATHSGLQIRSANLNFRFWFLQEISESAKLTVELSQFHLFIWKGFLPWYLGEKSKEPCIAETIQSLPVEKVCITMGHKQWPTQWVTSRIEKDAPMLPQATEESESEPREVKWSWQIGKFCSWWQSIY